MRDDAISRQAAIEAAYPFDDNERNLVDALEELPSAQIERQWVPCNVRLPEVGDKVLASTKNTVFTQVFKGTQGSVDSWWWNNNTIKTICAWMPQPKPFDGKE